MESSWFERGSGYRQFKATRVTGRMSSKESRMRCRWVPRHRIKTSAPPRGPAAEHRGPAASANSAAWRVSAASLGPGR